MTPPDIAPVDRIRIAAAMLAGIPGLAHYMSVSVDSPATVREMAPLLGATVNDTHEEARPGRVRYRRVVAGCQVCGVDVYIRWVVPAPDTAVVPEEVR